jgi:hypothetical protein
MAGLRKIGLIVTEVFLSILRNSSPLRVRDSESVNDTENSTNSSKRTSVAAIRNAKVSASTKK